ncbi:MAG TPA: hypothetical protein PKY59_12340 [Pyrinomonadaceae bacterium]|nr:hypothetical protein [Pyrinomonadaceae bacterium]
MKALISSIVLILFLSLSVFTQTAEISCPEFELILPAGLVAFGSPVNLSVKSNQNIENLKLNYEWTISNGKILKGQGTSEIVYLNEEYKSDMEIIQVSVKIVEMPNYCTKTNFSDTFNVVLTNYDRVDTVDSFGKLKFDELQARIDNFFIEINNNPGFEGLINIKFNKKDDRKEKTTLLKNIEKCIKYRKYDISRISLAISEKEDEQLTIFTIIPPEDVPKFADKNAVIIKGEDLKKSINNLFPLK